MAPFNPRGLKLVHSYRTNFSLNEYPISENGMWLSGRRDGMDWSDVITKNGMCYGEVSGFRYGGVMEQRAEQAHPIFGMVAAVEAAKGDYDDPTAILRGVWGRNQHVTAKVFSKNPTDKYFQEVEIRLRSTMTPHRIPGYEIFFRPLKTEKGYAEIVRWPGGLGEFVSLKRFDGEKYGVKDGDVVEATIEENVIKGFINGVEMISVTDDVYKTGSPGVGFNYGVGYTNADSGFTSFEVETYDD
ncbi:MAG TPA: hypothetical protein VE862_08145 [Candidatus Acidoferrum sp.]|nr:hypothetical protein [Candidatus Acidoferrum sp.]